MNTLVLVSPDTDTARKSGIGYLDLRFPVRAGFPTILNRRSLALFLFLAIRPSSHLLSFLPSVRLFLRNRHRYITGENAVWCIKRSLRVRRIGLLKIDALLWTWASVVFQQRMTFARCPNARKSIVGVATAGPPSCFRESERLSNDKQRADDVDRSRGRCIWFRRRAVRFGCISENPLCGYPDPARVDDVEGWEGAEDVS